MPEGMDIFEPQRHFGGQSVKRKKGRKLDDRGNELVKETGHQGADMPKRPQKKPKISNRMSGFENGPKTRY